MWLTLIFGKGTNIRIKYQSSASRVICILVEVDLAKLFGERLSSGIRISSCSASVNAADGSFRTAHDRITTVASSVLCYMHFSRCSARKLACKASSDRIHVDLRVQYPIFLLLHCRLLAQWWELAPSCSPCNSSRASTAFSTFHRPRLRRRGLGPTCSRALPSLAPIL